MRRVLRLLAAAALVAPVGACGTDGATPSDPDAKAALLRPSDLPGSWTLLGTTDRRPQVGEAADPLDNAEGTTPRCRAALDALDTATAGPTPDQGDASFARAVYRPSGSTPGGDAHDVTLTAESAQAAGRVADGITQVTRACTETMGTRAGAQSLKVSISRAEYSTPGVVGYTITYDTDGLRHHFDMAAVVVGSQGLTVSTTGPNTAANVRLLDTVLARAASRLAPDRIPATPPGATSGTASPSSTGSPTGSASSSSTRRPSSERSSSDRSDAPEPSRSGSSESESTSEPERSGSPRATTSD